MKRIPNQNGSKTELPTDNKQKFFFEDQNRSLLVVTDRLELLYSSESARKKLRLPKIGEKINSDDIVHGLDERFVYEGVRAALIEQQVQLYESVQIATSPEPLAAKLTIDPYPGCYTEKGQVLLEWVPIAKTSPTTSNGQAPGFDPVKKMNGALLEMEKNMNQLKAEMARLVRENIKLKIFAMSASHDLRNPLTTWRYSLELMGQYRSEARRAEACRDGRRAAKRFETQLNLLEELIYDEKIREGKAEEECFEKILKTVLFLLELDIKHCQAEINFDFSKKKNICFPKAFITVMLYNFISNACKYREKQRPLKINITSEQVDQQVLVKISDNGVGMSEDIIKSYLFQAYARPKQQQQGKGLGLHIVKSIIDQCEGRIEVKSKPGEGSTFCLWLRPYLPVRPLPV